MARGVPRVCLETHSATAARLRVCGVRRVVLARHHGCSCCIGRAVPCTHVCVVCVVYRRCLKQGQLLWVSVDFKDRDRAFGLCV